MSQHGLSSAHLSELKTLCEDIKKDPQLLHLPELDFLKNFIENFGGIVPGKYEDFEPEIPLPSEKMEEEPKEEEEPVENDPDLLNPDSDLSLEMGDFQKEVTEEMRTEAQSKRVEAINAENDGRLEESIQLFTESIELNPQSGLFYSGRAKVLLALQRPNAAIRDCTRAIELNPDPARPYHIRGKAYRFLGQYEKALKDIQAGQARDFLEESDALQVFLKDKVKLIQERRNKQKKQQKKPDVPPEAFNNPFGQIPRGVSPDVFQKIMSDPEVVAAMTDPEIMSKLQELMKDPTKINEMKMDPKLANLINKFVR
jgi:suppressor of tumorigenicity protein 13